MIISNLSVWNKVEKTNPLYAKKVSMRGGFTSIDAHSQVKAATEQFGPIGIGWGYECEYQFMPKMVVCLISIWHSGDRVNSYGPICGAAELKGGQGDADDNKYVQQMTSEFKEKPPFNDFDKHKALMIERINKGEAPEKIIESLRENFLVTENCEEAILKLGV
jgi:hypothetical protein